MAMTGLGAWMLSFCLVFSASPSHPLHSSRICRVFPLGAHLKMRERWPNRVTWRTETDKEHI